MAIKRHTLHLDEQDMKALAKIAQRETKETRMDVTAAGIVRRMIKGYLRNQSGKLDAPHRHNFATSPLV